MSNIINSFTGLRGLACMAVVACHWTNETVGQTFTLSEAGGMAVAFFFVLSGYLLVKREFESMQPTPDTKPDRFLGLRAVYFLIRRFLRMYPAYAVAAYAYKYVLVPMYQERRVNDGMVNAFNLDDTVLLKMKSNYSHLWTMSSEMVFSMCFLPVLMVVCSELMILDFKFFKRCPVKLNALFIIACNYYRLEMIEKIRYYEAPYGFKDPLTTHFETFWYGCLGGAFAFYVNHLGLNPKIEGGLKRLVAEGATYYLLFRIYLGNKWVAPIWGYPQIPPYDLAPIYVYLLLVLEFSNACNSFGRFMGSGIPSHIGEISYSVYLIHFFFLKYVTLNFSARGIDGLAIVYVYGLAGGQFLYTFVESMCIITGSFIIQQMKDISKFLHSAVQSTQEKITGNKAEENKNEENKPEKGDKSGYFSVDVQPELEIAERSNNNILGSIGKWKPLNQKGLTN